jgi:peptidoglycan L-alanyl-D-glutamate endopeptidase CwlK
MGKSLDELASYMFPLAVELIHQCEQAGVSVRIVDTGRTAAEQEQKLAQGVSWVPRSKHEPQPPEGKSEAVDIVPMSILAEHKPDWDPGHPDWQRIGAIGEKLGLRWGGSWQHHKDPSHFEFIHQKPENSLWPNA